MHQGGQRRKASAGGVGRSQEAVRTRTRCLETDVGRACTRGCAMRDHVRAVDEETLGMHGSGDADGAILVTEEVDYVESYIRRMGHGPTRPPD